MWCTTSGQHSCFLLTMTENPKTLNPKSLKNTLKTLKKLLETLESSKKKTKTKKKNHLKHPKITMRSLQFRVGASSKPGAGEERYFWASEGLSNLGF